MSTDEIYQVLLRLQCRTAIFSVAPTLVKFVVADFDEEKRQLLVSGCCSNNLLRGFSGQFSFLSEICCSPGYPASKMCSTTSQLSNGSIYVAVQSWGTFRKIS